MKLGRIGCFLTLITVFSVNAFAQPVKGKFVDHGPQITASMIQGSMFVSALDGRELVYTVVRGEPAHLLAYDIQTKELKLDKALGDADGVWDMAQSTDGTLYIPGASGSLFKHTPGTQEVTDLGIALKGETYLWNLTAGKDGEVFGATYPGCRVFRYHPKDGFSDIGKGPLVATENYVRSLAFHHKTGLLYAGVGSHANLLEIDPIKGTKKQILPEQYKDKEFVYSLEIVPGKNGQDRLFALLTSGNTTLVYNLKTKMFEQEISGMDMKAIIANAKTKEVYYTANSSLKSFQSSKSFTTAKQLAENVGSANAFAWGKDKNLYILTSGANLVKYNPQTKELTKDKLLVPGQPIPINAVLAGPDGKIWTGGYLAGGHATYDPITNTNTEYRGLHQTEGMTVYGDYIYYGIYPKGQFYEYNTKAKWNVENNNPRKIAQIPEQSRSFAVLPVTDENMLFFGMIPEYGKLGGAFVRYDRAKDEVKHSVLIPEHGISSLLYVNKMVIGGSTISGGLGVAPTQKEAVLFGWDIKNEKKTFELVPVPGAAAITSLINAPDGCVWGLADGVLFVFDPVAQKVLSTQKLYDYPPFKSHIWRSAFMVVHPNGQIYGTDNKKLFKIDAVSKACTILDDNATLLTLDKQGTLYFRRGTNLWSYQP
jgi:hypothetical protein